MKKKEAKKKIQWQQYIAVAIFMLIGGVCGVLMAQYVGKNVQPDTFIGVELFSLACLFLGMYVAIFIQLIIHEAGHLVFGLVSGYKFSSFRIFSFMWVKENEKVRLRRLSIAGTGGQCLMSPPDMKDGKIPLVLYNLGGSLMNVIASVVFFVLYIVTKNIPLLPVILLMCAIIGVAIAIMNGVPMRLGTVDNDGYNAFSLTRNNDAMRSFWIQMKVNEQLAKGMRLKDMPDEWFTVPSDEAMKNSMVVVMGVFACNRLMDQQDFQEADKLMKHIMDIDSGMVGLHRSLMVCDRMYIEMISENRKEIIDEILTKEQKQFMKQMKKFPSVLRTEYVLALLHDKDDAKAEQIKALFEKCAKSYPYQNDVISERELMDIAKAARL
ncbi:MAG: M50 family metallopeptidase [Lachnospiraceae bacterium]|nr:M50 family metallopeptidase [Lachnospiraceae bacterium]